MIAPCPTGRPVPRVAGCRALAGRPRGFSLIEVLVTLVVTAIGLLGLAALQARLQMSEIDAYQRTQALMLLQDMADRIAANRTQAAAYVTATGTALGTGDTPASNCSALTDIAARDRCEWSQTLQGAAETVGSGTGSQRGAMVEARGCIADIGNSSYLVSVVWQGLTPLTAPAGITCGAGNYGASGTACANDVCRRAVSTIVRIGILN